MLNIRNCRRCGKLFNLVGDPPLCQECRKIEEEDFKRLKEYLFNNPGATLSQVSLELDISIERIKRYLREGRLEIAGNSDSFLLECENCGAPIKSGRFCKDCLSDLTTELKKVSREISGSITNKADPKENHNIKYLYKDERKK
ncbi:MAG TPA: MerR family transcriptional regulator [Clostridiaceae bacterium]|nr:MerR family transcriptional regulator [Clostridiaceae bacterium]